MWLQFDRVGHGTKPRNGPALHQKGPSAATSREGTAKAKKANPLMNLRTLALPNAADRAESMHPLRPQCYRACSAGSDIQITLRPGFVLHCRKAAWSPFHRCCEEYECRISSIVFLLRCAIVSSVSRCKKLGERFHLGPSIGARIYDQPSCRPKF